MAERCADTLSDHYGLTPEQQVDDLLDRVKTLEAIVERLEQR